MRTGLRYTRAWQPDRPPQVLGVRRAHLSHAAGRVARVIATHAVLIAFSALFILPLWYQIASALMTNQQFYQSDLQFIPSPVRWQNVSDALGNFPFVRYTANTLTIEALSLVGTLISASLVAYSFSRVQWPGRDALFIVLLATIMIPPQVTIIPLFIVFRSLGWLNTYLPLVVPAFLGGSPFYIFLLRQYMTTIPSELSDAARIDGCHELGIFWMVVAPLCKPALAAVSVFSFVAVWNDFLYPLIFLHDQELWTLSLGLYSFQTMYGTDVTKLLAAGTVVVAPILVVFFFSQRYFIQGIALTGLKG